MLKFGYIPYPLWRRRGLRSPLMRRVLARIYPIEACEQAPATAIEMAAFLERWGLLPEGMSAAAARDALAARPFADRVVDNGDAAPSAVTATGRIRLPAQWERQEAVIMRWPVAFPPLWEVHAQLAEAISPVARCDILIDAPAWADPIGLFLERRGEAQLDNIRFLVVPANDIWVRDYGPVVGFNGRQRVAVSAIFDPLPAYPQAQDDAVPERYAALTGLPLRRLDLHLEGGNLWSDGAGTLLMSEGLFARNPHLSREETLRRLRAAFDYEKLLLVPPLRSEETGHIDLVLKLADAETILISAPAPLLNRRTLHKAADVLRGETNAAGRPYRLIPLPMPQPYFNWGLYPIWRSYANALTINGRLLVPTYGLRSDHAALIAYRTALPDYVLRPIYCVTAINGGGAVHCLTKEIPAHEA